jgi:hypothetical protein
LFINALNMIVSSLKINNESDENDRVESENSKLMNVMKKNNEIRLKTKTSKIAF